MNSISKISSNILLSGICSRTASNPGDTNDKTSQGLNPFYSGEREKGLTYEWVSTLGLKMAASK